MHLRHFYSLASKYRRTLMLHMARGAAYGAGTTAVSLFAVWWQRTH
ncbi:hypothetical protein [Actinacidiphila glaucinigra]|uniref:Uncharacterized protein n=1 Tax=Actinacidiphila glaucinigra TaxID=235986 RepID=A0A239LUN0_9ACTN|nr:hypothetical protein [Actinacidiphila glaucinigra]SNT34236.1 hypothetical protein SAMN05216252_121109 [Actinacidiphila glaucinigra]